MLATSLLVLSMAQVGVVENTSPAPDAKFSAPNRDAWKSFDFYGHYDNKGVFVYSQVRVHREPVKNFGVDLAGHTPAIVGEVRGTDKDLGHELAEALVNPGGPCPGPNPCPRRPEPEPEPGPRPRLPIDPLSPLNPAGGLALWPLLLAGLLMSLTFLVVLLVLLVILVRRRP